MSNPFYVYVLRDPRNDNQPFYVGYGRDRRAMDHLRPKQNPYDSRWMYAVIEEIREAGLEPIIEYHTTNLSKTDAENLEVELTKQYGRAGIDEGGILSNRHIGNRLNEDEKQYRREFNLKHGIKPQVRTGPMSQEQKDNIAAGNRGKKRTPEQSAHLSEIRRGQKRGPYSEEHRAAIRRSLGGNEFPEDLTGLKFTQWTVLSRAPDRRDTGQRGANAEFWLCTNGKKEKEVSRRDLIRVHKKMLAKETVA